MLFKFTLLAGLLLLSVDAAPRPRTSYGTVTLPLKRLEQRSDAHPQIVSTISTSSPDSDHQVCRPTSKISTAVIAAMRE